MNWRNTPTCWGGVAQLLHWLIALMIIALAALGLLMDELPTSMTKVRLYSLHKSLGMTVLLLVILRLGWRLFDRRPGYPSAMPAWQVRLAEVTHGLLYVLLLAIPLSGWLYNSASNFPLRWFGLISLPALTGPDKALKTLALDLHGFGFYLLAVLFVVHVAAALKHHYIDRDDTLRRMWPSRRY